jgi:hypothetical protein
MHFPNVIHHLVLSRKPSSTNFLAANALFYRTPVDCRLSCVGSVEMSVKVVPASEGFVAAARGGAVEGKGVGSLGGVNGADV